MDAFYAEIEFLPWGELFIRERPVAQGVLRPVARE